MVNPCWLITSHMHPRAIRAQRSSPINAQPPKISHLNPNTALMHIPSLHSPATTINLLITVLPRVLPVVVLGQNSTVLTSIAPW